MNLTHEARPILAAIIRNLPKGARGRTALEAEARRLTHTALRNELEFAAGFEGFLMEEMEAVTDG